MAKTQKEPTTTPETDEIPKSSFGGKLVQYTFTGKPTASPIRRITRSSTSTLQSTIPNHLPPPILPSPSQSTTSPPPSKRKRPSPTPSSSPTSNPKKRKRPPSSSSSTPSVNPPNLLRDTLAPHLLILFIGCNPGLLTGSTGFAYAHPSNLFYKLCHASHITPRLVAPSEYHSLPEKFGIGNTNIVGRVTRDMSGLSKGEMDAGVGVLEAKVGRWRPEVVAVVGKGVWEAVRRVRGGGMKGFRYGWQGEEENMGKGEGWGGARVFVATTTSGLAAGMTWGEKVGVWTELGEWVVRRRGERERERLEGGGKGVDKGEEGERGEGSEEGVVVE